jgi:hypothetical protein
MVVDEERDKRGGQNQADQILHKLFLIQKKKALSDLEIFQKGFIQRYNYTRNSNYLLILE